MGRRIVILLNIVLIFALSACGKNTGFNIDEEKFYDCQKGFTGSLGNPICETPDGYYFLMGNYIMFVDEKMEKSSIVCGKAECLHNEEQPENKINCDAFFDVARSISYCDGKLYVLSYNWSKKQGRNNVSTIYEVELDGSSRKEVYSGGEYVQSFCIHRGNVYVYEKKYMNENGKVSKNPIVAITEVSLNNPQKEKILFQTEEYKRVEINDLVCYQDYCYFCLFLPEEFICMGKKIDLRTGEVSDFVKDSEEFWIGKDRVFSTDITEHDNVNWTWKETDYQWGLDGETATELPAEKFRAIGENAMLCFVDDKYVYFSDINYGANEVPRDKRKLYVYTYDGELVCEIPCSKLQYVSGNYSGNEKYLFFYERVQKELLNENGKTEIVGEELRYYYVEKEKFGKGAEIELMYAGDSEAFLGTVIY